MSIKAKVLLLLLSIFGFSICKGMPKKITFVFSSDFLPKNISLYQYEGSQEILIDTKQSRNDTLIEMPLNLRKQQVLRAVIQYEQFVFFEDIILNKKEKDIVFRFKFTTAVSYDLNTNSNLNNLWFSFKKQDLHLKNDIYAYVDSSFQSKSSTKQSKNNNLRIEQLKDALLKLRVEFLTKSDDPLYQLLIQCCSASENLPLEFRLRRIHEDNFLKALKSDPNLVLQTPLLSDFFADKLILWQQINDTEISLVKETEFYNFLFSDKDMKALNKKVLKHIRFLFSRSIKKD